MRIGLSLLALFSILVGIASAGRASSVNPPHIDLGYLVLPHQLKSIHQMGTFSVELDEIIRVGARALDWVDVLQKDVPPAEREQVWRRADRIGHEADPEHPMYYNGEICLDSYNKAIEEMPAALVKILRDNGPLPTAAPEGFTNKDIVAEIRGVYNAYSRTSRWMMLSNYRTGLPKRNLDLRGWLKINREQEALVTIAKTWSKTSQDVRARFVAELSDACEIGGIGTVESCLRDNQSLIKLSSGGMRALAFLNRVLVEGRKFYDTKFGIQQTHAGVRLSFHNGFRQIEVPTYGINGEIFDWIQDRVHEAWIFGDQLGVTLYDAGSHIQGAMHVVWEKGTLPHVNGVGGDTITMDSNTPKWLEQTQTTMRHEMGHVIGFADCYTEFWDEQLGAFTYYSLDANDAMCALSGQYLERHRDALIKGYF